MRFRVLRCRLCGFPMRLRGRRPGAGSGKMCRPCFKEVRP